MRAFTDNLGRVLAKAGPPPPGSAFLGGLAFADDTSVYCTFTQLPTDVYMNGRRVSALGEVIVVEAVPPFVYNEGLAAKEGSGDAIVVVINGTPSPDDPYINGGLRVEAVGRLFIQSTITPPPPLTSGFDSGFTIGFGS